MALELIVISLQLLLYKRKLHYSGHMCQIGQKLSTRVALMKSDASPCLQRYRDYRQSLHQEESHKKFPEFVLLHASGGIGCRLN